MYVFSPARQAALRANKGHLPTESLDINSREARRRKERIEKRKAKKRERKEHDRY